MDDQNRDAGGTGGGYGSGTGMGAGGAAGLGGAGTVGGTGAGTANTPDFGGTGTTTPDAGAAGLGAPGQGGASGVEDRANQVLGRAAEGMETAANRLHGLADRQGGQAGAMGKANDLAHQAASTMESTARYLRDNDVRALQSDLERMVREKPLQTLLMGVAAGWVLGKILR